jgi:malate dehydrogenase (quinone)
MDNPIQTDVVLIGAGIMSATLGLMLKELDPNLKIDIFERLDVVAGESSDAWNNAGTGHSAFCELNYTPQDEDGTIDISKAFKIASSFEISKQFYSYLVEKGYISNPDTFINVVPHISFVWGEDNVAYLKERHAMLTEHALFEGMEYTEDPEQMKEWMPLVMENRDTKEKVAATRMPIGTDIDFGDLTRIIFDILTKKEGVTLHLNHEVRDLEKEKDGRWRVKVKDMKSRKRETVYSYFVFIGAGGGSLPLLEKSDIEEGEGYGGFPISGQWLRCLNEDIIARHDVKVYGKASVGAPPMSVPHLDARMVDGKKALLFGPFAGFSTKFLKNGSYFDLPFSLDIHNIIPMISAGVHNLSLTKYLIGQVAQSMDDRLDALREYFPNAKEDDWELAIAGQRVQVIKKDEEEGGVLEFGTEVIAAADGSLAALLGASPGASTAVTIMLSLLEECFAEKMKTNQWQTKIKEMIPTYGIPLIENETLCRETRSKTSKVLFGLEQVES